jgi:hypothetical protein
MRLRAIVAQAASAPGRRHEIGRGRSLGDYRAQAHAVLGSPMRTPVPSDPLAFQRGGARSLANYRAEAPTTTMPATLEAQRLAELQTGATAEQSWVTAMMGAGLDRYRDAQRRRDGARIE